MKDGLGDVQSILVLGGGSDIAQATVRRLVERRCRTVVLAAHHPEAVEPFAAELRAAGASDVSVVAFDAADTASHAAVIDAAFAEHEDIDVVLLAFAVLGDQAAFDADPGAAVAVAQVNYVGSVSVGLLAASCLRAQGHGLLVVLSSVAGVRARAVNFVYGSTKAGLDAFAQGLGDRLAGSGASVLVVRPGFVRTKMTAGMKDAPMSTGPEQVADAIVAGIRKGRRIVWVPATLRPTFGLLRLAPQVVWRRLPG